MGQGEVKSKLDSRYDLQIEIASLQDLLTTGWKVMGHVDAFSDSEKNKDLMFVGVLGLYNRGKTFTLNKLADTHLQEGYEVHTPGISFKNPATKGRPGQKYMLVDIAGFNAPISNLNDGIIESQFQKDRVIQEIIIRLCYVFIVVVNDITLDDQLFIQNLRQAVMVLRNKTQYGLKYDDIIVIHNFSKISDVTLMEKVYQDQVVEKGEPGGRWNEQFLTNSSTSLSYFYTPPSDLTVGIRHIPIMKDGGKETPCRKHNESMFSLVQCWLQSLSYNRSISPVEEFLKCGDDVLNQYIDNPSKLSLFTDESKTTVIGWQNKGKTSEVSIAKEGKGSFFKRNVFIPRYFIPPPEVFATQNAHFKYDILVDENTDPKAKFVRVIVECPGSVPKDQRERIMQLKKKYGDSVPDFTNLPQTERKEFEEQFYYEPTIIEEEWIPEKGTINISLQKSRSQCYDISNVKDTPYKRSWENNIERYSIDVKGILPSTPSLEFRRKQVQPGGLIVYTLEIREKQKIEEE